MPFALHPQLAQDCAPVTDLTLCRVLLMDNALFPWLILVPMREGLRELHDLCAADYTAAMEELRRVASALQRFTGADKMNVAALGNMVPQLHIHVIARFANDAAWPRPVWNASVSGHPYAADARVNLIHDLQSVIA